LRFKKQVLCAVASVEGDAINNKSLCMKVERINVLLNNIGLSEMSREELDDLEREIGANDDHTISIEKMMKVL